MDSNTNKEEDLLKYQEKLVDQKIKNEEIQRQRMMQNQKSDAQAGLTELQTKKKQDQMMRDMEREMHKEKMLKEQMLSEKNRRNNLEKKRNGESEYHNLLNMQAKEKQMKLRQDKESDKQFAIAENAKMDYDEQNRNRFFNKLKDIQSKNDEKHHRLLKFMEQDATVISAKRDEKNYIKNIELGEKKAVRKEFSEKQNKAHSLVDNFDILGKQLQEK